MTAHFGSDPARLVVWIGPSIGPQGYGVGEDVAEQREQRIPIPPWSRSAVRERGQVSIRPCGARTSPIWRYAGFPRDQIELMAIDTYTSTDRLLSDRRVRRWWSKPWRCGRNHGAGHDLGVTEAAE